MECLRFKSDALPLRHSIDNMDRPVLVLIQGKVLHNSGDR